MIRIILTDRSDLEQISACDFMDIFRRDIGIALFKIHNLHARGNRFAFHRKKHCQYIHSVILFSILILPVMFLLDNSDF